MLPKTSCSKFILQDYGTEFKNEQLISVFDNLGIKWVYSNPYYSRGNSRIEIMHNFIQQTIATFMHGSELKWDDALPLATYCYNIMPSLDDLKSPFHLEHGSDPLEGRLSNLQNFCRPSCLVVQNSGKCGNCMQNY